MADFGQNDKAVFGAGDKRVRGAYAPDRGRSVREGAEEFLGQAARSIGGAMDFMTLPGQAAGEYLRQAQGFEPSENPGGAITEVLADMGVASRGEPESVVGSAGAGMGDAMAALLPVAGALNQLRTVGGVTGAVADDVLKYLTTRSSVFAVEPLSGAASGAASRAVEEAGGNEFMQTAAGMAAPLAVPLAGEAVRQGFRAVRGVQNLADRGILAATDAIGVTQAPNNGLPRRGPLQAVRETVAQAIIPQTQAGARVTAANRARQVVGEETRYRVADAINPQDPYGRTAADQTGDPGLLALQQERANVDPDFRERLEARRQGVQQSILEEVRSLGGDPTDAKAFFRRRFVQFERAMRDRIAAVEAEAAQAADLGGPDKSVSSLQVSEKLNEALTAARDEERALWGAVPKSETMPTESIKARAQSLIDSNSKFQSGDVPEVIQQLLSNQVGDTETVGEMHGLYSELRRISRVARAGDTQNRNMARIADGVADAILAAFDELPGSEIAEARAFTRAMNQTFYTGASGRILNQTNQSVSRIAPEAALDATVGRGRAQGGVDARNIANAAPEAAQGVQDYLRKGFSDALVNASGDVSAKSARTWMRQNSEALKEYPELRAEMLEASRKQDEAKAYAARIEERIKVVEGGPSVKFSTEEPDLAADLILGAKNPQRTARQIMRDARRDETGAAIEGVKGAISLRLEAKYEKLPDLLRDPKIKAALSQVYNGREMERLTKISEVIENMGATPSSIGAILNEPNNVLMDTIVRVGAAKASSVLGSDNAGVGLQQAQIASSRAKDLLSRMTNKKAREILFKAIEDPELMRVLLTEETQNLSQSAIAKLTPYLVGGAAGVEEDE